MNGRMGVTLYPMNGILGAIKEHAVFTVDSFFVPIIVASIMTVRILINKIAVKSGNIFVSLIQV